MEIKIEDYLTDEEVKDIIASEVRAGLEGAEES